MLICIKYYKKIYKSFLIYWFKLKYIFLEEGKVVNGGKGRNIFDKSLLEKDNEELKLKVKIEENVKNIGKIILFVKSDY